MFDNSNFQSIGQTDDRLQFCRSQTFNAYSSIYGSSTSESESLQKPPLSISPEFDLLFEQHRGNPNIDRSNWLQQILDTHPDIKELRECVNPIARAASFANLYLPPNRMISHEVLLALISQHLRTLGLSEAQASLHSEWGSEFNIPPHKLYSQLALLIQRGVQQAERFWELSIPSIHAPKKKDIQTALDEEISRTIGASSNVVVESKKNNDDSKEVYHDIKNIIDERPGDPRYFKKDENGNLLYASLNQLIYYITSDDDDISRSEIRSALCLTVSSYSSSMAFFTKLRDRFMNIIDKLKTLKPNQNSEMSDVSDDYGKAKFTGLRCVKVLKEWIKEAINDIEPQVLDAIKLFVDKEVSKYYPQQVQVIFEGRPRAANQNQPNEEKPSPIDLGNINGLWTGNFSLFDLPIVELARQLTVWSSTRYYSTQRSELLDCPWMVPRLKYRAPNIIALTDHYNKVTSWAIYSVLSEGSFERRIERMEHLAALGSTLFDMNNFFDGAAIVLSFFQPQLFNLAKHRERLKPATLAKLDDLNLMCEPGDNYKTLRKIQLEALNNGNPVVPSINVLIQDIFNISDNQNYVNGLINVLKCKRTYKTITDFEVYKRKKYCFLSIDQVQAKIDQIELYDEEFLYSLQEALPEK